MEAQLCKKVAFSDEKQALFYVDKLKKTSDRPVVPQRAYLCQKCNNWHLTSKQENKTYTAILAENELLKKQLADKERIISEIKGYNAAKGALDKDALIKQKNDKLVEQNNKISKLESKLKKKDKAMKAMAKIILDSMDSK
jgi:hypothetical protein